MNRVSLVFTFCSIVSSAAACSSENAVSPLTPSTDAVSAPAPACEDGATRCKDGKAVERCQTENGVASFVAESCTADATCRDGACVEATDRQKRQAASVAEYLDTLLQISAWPGPVDADAIKSRERDAIFAGDGSDAIFVGSMWRAMHAVPQGHQAIQAPAVCGKSVPYQHGSRLGACVRPHEDGLVVTFARPENALGVEAGDVIVAVDSARGSAILDEALDRPVCGSFFPAPAARRTSAAVSFMNTVPKGAKLVIKPAGGGAERVVTTPAGSSNQLLDCTDPLGRDTFFNAKATLLADGTGLIQLPRFTPMDDNSNPQTDAELAEFITKFRGKILAEFAKVKDAPRLVWDARGNGGGISSVGLDIVSGMPSARATTLSYCRQRIAQSSPPAYDDTHYAEYAVAPGGDFSYAGKVAVLVDALDYSASDYFSFAIRRATDVPLVGEGTAGGYGGGGASFPIEGPPAVTAYFDSNRCFDASDDSDLEGRGVEPTHEVSYQPADLAAGRDTVLEAAIALLKQ